MTVDVDTVSTLCYVECQSNCISECHFHTNVVKDNRLLLYEWKVVFLTFCNLLSPLLSDFSVSFVDLY